MIKLRFYGSLFFFLSHYMCFLFSYFIFVALFMSQKTINVIILISTLYFFTYSFAHFYEYGFSLSWESLSIILDPGHAYMNKFLIYEQFEVEHRVSLCIQVLVLFGAVYAALIPILVVFWEKIYNSIRCLAISSIFCLS